MRRLAKILGAFLVGTAAMAWPASAKEADPEIWFFLRPYAMSAHGVDGQQGWRKLFLDPDAQWPAFMDHVQIVGFSGDLRTVPDSVLTKAFSVMAGKRVGFAIESLAQSWVGLPEHCGHGVEGYTDPPGNAAIARRIKAAGGELVYVTMDGPFSTGHYYDGPNACHDPIPIVAARAAAVMREYKKVFPNVRIGDTEPFPALTKHPTWRRDYQEWMRAFEQAYGAPIEFLNMDVNWPQDAGHWQASLREAVDFAHANHLPIGIIYNAAIPGGAQSDRQWLNSALSNITAVESGLGVVPDKALFESWAFFPKRSITDADGLGEDYLVTQYAQVHGLR